MNKNILIGLGVMFLVIALGSYLERNSKPVIVKPNKEVVSVSSPAKNEVDGESINEIVLTAKDFSITPNKVNVKKGDKLKITFKNEGLFAHNFLINGLGVKIESVKSGEESSVDITANKIGEFQFECTVDGHKDLGMQGTITVE